MLKLLYLLVFSTNNKIDFPTWKKRMDYWGTCMLSAVEVLSQMVAIGFGLPSDAFTSRIQNGPHLLAPTVSSEAITRAKR